MRVDWQGVMLNIYFTNDILLMGFTIQEIADLVKRVVLEKNRKKIICMKYLDFVTEKRNVPWATANTSL